MTPVEAADVIEAMAQALRANPRQFHINISVIGQRVTSYGGIGMQVNATGGGPGSTTIGNQVSMGGADIQLAQQQGAAAMEQQFAALLQTLANIATELRSAKPDRSVIQRALDSLKNTWVPGVIIGVAGNVATQALGLG
jgi:hypothetical protein